jgi:dTDP-4-dehydrorhamnose reductase
VSAPRVLVLGAGGQVGRALLARAASARTAIFGLTRQELDIVDRRAAEEILARIDAPIVVNAAAYTAVDRAEREAASCFRVNRDAAGGIADICTRQSRVLIHLSTDYVFDGSKGRPYGVEDAVAPINVYGASKAAGESLVRASSDAHIVLRTSWVHAPWGNNFVRSVITRMRQGQPLRVVNDQRGSPSAADEVARAALLLAARLPDRTLGGVHHWTGNGVTTWFEVAKLVVQTFSALGGPAANVEAIGTAEGPSMARRPPYSVLDSSRLGTLLGVAPAEWPAGVVDSVHGMLDERRARPTAFAS